MQVVETIAELRAARRELSGRVGVVLTMGYLHKGHLALVKAAREQCDSVLATIFVNPTQFAEGEDLSTYPRDMPRDLRLLEEAGVDLVFTPTPELMYPPRFQTWVTVDEVAKGKEGGQRPGHFRGVTTIVSKLFNLTQPDFAYFGQKDAQQVVVIRQMVRDLNFPLEIVVCPVVRAEDGLALSSRNVYLSTEERRAATALNRALKAAGECYETGERNPEILRQAAAEVLAAEPLVLVDYISLANAGTLEEITEPTQQPLLLSLAAQVGKPRLLDNCLLPIHLNTQEAATQWLGV